MDNLPLKASKKDETNRKGRKNSIGDEIKDLPQIFTRNRDGVCCWMDYIIIERPWHSLKCEEVYLKAYDTAGTARAKVKNECGTSGLINPLLFKHQEKFISIN